MTDVQDDVADQAFIKSLLKKNGGMFTNDIMQALIDHKQGKAAPDCNDRTMRNLILMKRQGMIIGKMNRQKRTWEWSLGK